MIKVKILYKNNREFYINLKGFKFKDLKYKISMKNNLKNK